MGKLVSSVGVNCIIHSFSKFRNVKIPILIVISHDTCVDKNHLKLMEKAILYLNSIIKRSTKIFCL